MKKRVRRPAPAGASADTGSSSRHRGTLWLCGVLVGIVILGTIYFWPQHEAAAPPPTVSAAPVLVLPTEPEERTVQQLREEAELVVAQLLKRHPQSPAAHKSAATLYQFLNQFGRVTEHWEKCIALDPSDAVAHEWLVKAQLKQGNDDSAARALESARKAGLRTAELFVQSAIVEQRRGKLADAEQIARQGLDEFPEHGDLLIALGQAQLQMRQFELARHSFESALRADPESTAAHFGLANACQRLGDKVAAEAHRRRVEQSLSARRQSTLPFDQYYEETLRLAVAAALSSAGTVYDEHGDRAEAERLCQRAFSVHPGYPDPYRQLANMYHREGKIESAIGVQQRLAQIEPENDANHLNLASLLFQARRINEGEAALLAGWRAAPQKAIFPQSLAAIYLQSGQLVKARECAEQATRLAPTPERFQLLAEICRQQADPAAADAALAAAGDLASGTRP